jgi:hypothetical protein
VTSSQRIRIAIGLSLLAHLSLLAFAPSRPMEPPPLAATASNPVARTVITFSASLDCTVASAVPA